MTRETIEIWPIGSAVLIDGEIPAKITAIEIRGDVHLVTYQCAWWDERKRQSEWLTEAEFVPQGARPMKGFASRQER